MDMRKYAAEESKGGKTFRIKKHPDCRSLENDEQLADSSGKGQTKEEAGAVRILVFLQLLDSFSQWDTPPLSTLVPL